jgi:hypothetical protein
MALSEQVQGSLKSAETNLRDALAFAARNERPMVCNVISDVISRIDSMMDADEIIDKLENREFGSKGKFGPFFGLED